MYCFQNISVLKTGIWNWHWDSLNEKREVKSFSKTQLAWVVMKPVETPTEPVEFQSSWLIRVSCDAILPPARCPSHPPCAPAASPAHALHPRHAPALRFWNDTLVLFILAAGLFSWSYLLSAPITIISTLFIFYFGCYKTHTLSVLFWLSQQAGIGDRMYMFSYN
jgi:hypothetical protein